MHAAAVLHLARAASTSCTRAKARAVGYPIFGPGPSSAPSCQPGRLAVHLVNDPIGYAFDEREPTVEFDYFDTQLIIDETEGTYADLEAQTIHNLSYQWPHPLPQLFEALLGAGFQLRFFHVGPHPLQAQRVVGSR